MAKNSPIKRNKSIKPALSIYYKKYFLIFKSLSQQYLTKILNLLILVLIKYP